MMRQKILVVDDEPSIVEVLSLYLKREGYDVLTAGDGAEAMKLAGAKHPDLILLDIMLPYRSGLDITSTLRENGSVPIILITARTDEMDRIAGLELGADDYVVKPFSPREVVARVKAVLRRTTTVEPETQTLQPIEVGCVAIDPGTRSAYIEDQLADLTAKEFDLLYFMARSPRQVFSRSQLLDQVWGADVIADESTVTVHVRRLREKIEAEPSNPRIVQTVWGVGYRFNGCSNR